MSSSKINNDTNSKMNNDTNSNTSGNKPNSNTINDKPNSNTFNANPNRNTSGNKPNIRIKKGTAKRLFKLTLKSNPIGLVLVGIFVVVSAIAGGAGPIFVKNIIDNHIAPMIGTTNPNYTNLIRAVGILATIYVIGITCTFLFNRMMVVIAQKTLKNIRDEMFAHMQSLPLKFYDTHSRGDIMSLYTNDADTLREFISQLLPQFLAGVTTIGVVAVAMLILNVYLSVLVAIFVTLMLTLSKKFSKKASFYFRNQQQSVATLNGYIEETLNGQKVVKVFCHEQASINEFQEKNTQLYGYSAKAHKMTNILMPIMMELGNFQYAIIALIGSFMAIKGFGNVGLGTIAGFLMLSKSFSAPIGQISSQINVIISALAGASRIFNFLDTPFEPDSGFVTLVFAYYQDGELKETKENTGIWAWKQPNPDGTFTLTRVKGEMVFQNVDFGYSDDKIILHNINLHAKAGQKIAFVGATGAGKTTITNLINRFYDFSKGQIFYDGIELKNFKKDDLRRSLGIVLQDTHLFSGTIEDNIRYGNMLATKDEIILATKLANAHDFIMRLPQGYDTWISSDGANLSGGQRQLIAIARAAVADPPIMILDEATSSIDTRTEQLVQKGMDGLMHGRTVFVIAHRLSTVRNSDVIIVLEDGKIIESGNHDQLIKRGGKYYQLYTGGLAE